MPHTRIPMANLLRSTATALALGGCVAGCANVPKAGVAPRIRTIASVGDRTLPVVSGAPDDAIVADREGPGPGPRVGGDGRVSGRVVDKKGKPIPNAEVRLAVGGVKRGRAVKAVTDESGAFTLHGLRKGVAYTVIAERADGADVLSGRAPVQAPEHDVRIILAPDDGKDGDGAAPRKADADLEDAPGRVNRVADRQDEAEEEDPGAHRPAARINAEDIPPAEDAEDITPPDPEDAPVPHSRTHAPATPPASGWRRGASADDRRSSQLPATEPDTEPASEPVAEAAHVTRASPEANPPAARPAAPDLDRTLATAATRPEPAPDPKPAPPAAIEPLAIAPDPTPTPTPADPPKPAETAAGGDQPAPPEPTPSPTPGAAAPAEPVEKPAGGTSSAADPLPPLDEPGSPAPAVAEKPATADPAGAGDHVAASAPTGPGPAPATPEASGAVAAGSVAAPKPTEEAAAPPAPVATPTPADVPGTKPADAPSTGEGAAAPAGLSDATPAPEAPQAPRRRVTWGELPAPSATKVAAAEPRRSRIGKLGRSPAKAKDKAEPDVLAAVDGEPAACQFDGRRQQLLDFRLPDLQGRTVRFQDLGADLVLLDFWGTWCNPCLESVPHLVDLQQRLGGRGLKIIGIAYEQSGTTAERVAAVGESARKLGINYQVLLGDIETCPLQAAFHVQAYPTMILLDRDGRVLWRDQGSSAGTLARLDRVVDAQARALVARR